MAQGTSSTRLQTRSTISTGRPRVRRWVRGILILIVVGLIAVFVTAIQLNPYDPEGNPLKMETHRQLGLPSCKFYELYHKPCPACGLTTSFSLLMHGDLVHSLQANFVGTLMAIFCMGLIPWSAYVAIRGRYLWIQALEPALLVVVGFFTILLVVRWGIVLVF
jgi:hypothetical protein